MTRIIGGTVGGRRIAVPPTRTRPTSDRVREALFSLLDARGLLEDARVLDLYAGSGALGLEALSRGASTAVLVDRDPQACTVLRTNASSLGLAGAAVRRSTASSYLRAGARSPVDVAFLDPPYTDPVDDVLGALVDWLAPGALVAVERDARSGPPTWPPGLEPEDARRHGGTRLHLAAAPGPPRS